MVYDASARLQAIDPTRSFIVQAPAGSGKTELLTQRYLRLLAKVETPEHIIALTFTRKAASEMRERILKALSQAQADLPHLSAHQHLTQEYAKAALAQSQALNWQLLQQPHRLKIMTIDALCHLLSHSIPLHEQWVPFAAVTENAPLLYQKAVHSFLQDIMEQSQWHAALKDLLLHLDNQQDRLIDLLCTVLAQREHWIPLIFAAQEQTIADFEQAFAVIEQHELSRFLHSIPEHLKEELYQLCTQFANIDTDPTSLGNSLKNWSDALSLDRHIAACLAALLLTKENKLRKSFDHHVGLKKGCCPPALYQFLKDHSKALLEALAEYPDFIKALVRIKNLPPPTYTPQQWTILKILLALLPLLAAHLQWVFRTENAVDFTDIAQQALAALGTEDNPTDLALYLDHTIHHLLIDEFQDTSLQQYQLLHKLLAGWLPQDNKTLFLVGDPMQSIYRFRQAEVGLFLKAKEQGIGAIKLHPLELSCNFRSTPTVIAWINEQFKFIFPQTDDMEMGAVSFSCSMAARDPSPNSSIVAISCDNPLEEAQQVVRMVSEQLSAYPGETIAILVRSRTQLKEIVPLLRAQAIPFQGIDIEPLATLSFIQDIFALTQALCMPENRLAWLTFLRSPWGGLNLADIYCLANSDPKRSIYTILADINTLTGLSEEGRCRLLFIYPILQRALLTRHQLPIVDWLNHTLFQLHRDKILNFREQASLEEFWALLIHFTPEHGYPDLIQLETAIKERYSQKLSPARLQIMTIHKSKGLEFDTVILPGLGSTRLKTDRTLLRCLRLPALDNDLFLMSPLRSVDDTEDALYSYLGNIDKEKEQYEQQRLLYVAVTRAKKRLFLLDCKEKMREGSFRALLHTTPFIFLSPQPSSNDIKHLPKLKRLNQSYYRKPLVQETFPASMPITITHNPTTRQIGIIAHELLQWMGTHHETRLEHLPWSLVRNRLYHCGFNTSEQNAVIEELSKQIAHMLQTPFGSWIFEQHAEEHNEYALLSEKNGEVKTYVIDRIFKENGVLWIIDYKTGRDDPLVQQEHRQQLNQYAHLFADQEASIQCGIVYLMNTTWVTWEIISKTVC